MSAQETIEKHFNLPFIEVIKQLHWNDKRSIKNLSDSCGISGDTFQRLVKKYELDLRNSKEACSISAHRGEDHWAFGLTKETSKVHLAHSERMKANNPTGNSKVMNKRAESMAIHFRKTPLKQEVQFIKILQNLKIEAIFQYPIGRYIIDFFLPEHNLLIEIDSTDKWGKSRRNRAAIKDKFLIGRGFKVLRINKRFLKDRALVLNILYSNNIIRKT